MIKLLLYLLLFVLLPIYLHKSRGFLNPNMLDGDHIVMTLQTSLVILTPVIALMEDAVAVEFAAAAAALLRAFAATTAAVLAA